MPVVVPLEEEIGGGAETIPHHFRLVAAHGTDGLPLGLHPLQFCRRGIPVRGFRQGFGASAERFLLLEVVVPFLLLRREVVTTTGEEGVAGGAEPLCEIARGVAWHGAHGLPFGLEFLETRGRFRPIGGLGQLLGFLDERLFAFEVAAAFFLQLREVHLAAAADEVSGGLETIPETLCGVARRIGHFLPAQVELTQGLRGRCQLGRLAGFFIGLQRGDDRLRHGNELFLLLGVGEPAPFVHVAQFLHLGRDGFLLRTKCGDGVADLLGGFPGARFLEHRRDVAHQPFALAQRDGFGFRHALGAFGQALHARRQILARLRGRFPSRRLTRLEGT